MEHLRPLLSRAWGGGGTLIFSHISRLEQYFCVDKLAIVLLRIFTIFFFFLKISKKTLTSENDHI